MVHDKLEEMEPLLYERIEVIDQETSHNTSRSVRPQHKMKLHVTSDSSVAAVGSGTERIGWQCEQSSLCRLRYSGHL